MANHHLCKTLSAAALLLGAQGALAAPVLQYSTSNPQELLGASGVSVNSQLYNVLFETSSCSAVFSNCAASTFAFVTSADATAAANALLTEIGVAAFQNASQIGLPVAGNLQSFILTPFNVTSSVVSVSEFDFRNGTVFAGNLSASLAARSANAAYAVWSLDTANVPEPASAATLAAGVAALAVARRRRRKKK